MALATMQGKIHARNMLRLRREENKTRPRIDNASLHAGSPMHFDCIACGEDIAVPESYLSKPDKCPECTALAQLDWLK